MNTNQSLVQATVWVINQRFNSGPVRKKFKKLVTVMTDL